MPRYRVPPPANDEPKAPLVRCEGLEAPPLCVAEVEIFDVLISNIDELTLAIDLANDNKGPSPGEKRP